MFESELAFNPEDAREVVVSELKELEDRLRTIIQTKCNTLGCKECDLKNYVYRNVDTGSDCAATDLQNKITDIEMNEVKK